MSIKFTVEGIDFTVDTAAEVAAIVRELRGLRRVAMKAAPVETMAKNAANAKAERESNEPDAGFPNWAPGAALKFLTTIRDGGPNGVSAEPIMRALNASTPKAIGGRSAIINRLLRKHGFTPTHVYDNERTQKGRVWIPRKQLPNAISQLEQGLAA
jgi:hypothetical protein